MASTPSCRTSATYQDDSLTVDNEEAFTQRTEKNVHDPFLVRFDEGDPANPKNWSNLKKWYITMLGGLLVLNARVVALCGALCGRLICRQRTFASSAPSGILAELIKEFHLSREVGTLTISLFVAGYCVGPLLWAPLSESYGRKIIFIITFIFYTAFQIGPALAKNVGSILAFRFLGGVFAAAPLTNSGALLSDIWDAKKRGMAMAIFTCAPFSGPAIGPTVTGFIVASGTSWRWAFWVLTIFAGVCLLLILFTLPETYEPILLNQKAKRMRKETGDSRWYAPLERQNLSFMRRLEEILARPFTILVREPMLIAITVYMSFVYGCIYLLFEAYPIVFTEGHNFTNPGISGLMFLPVALGGIVAVVCILFYFNRRYERAVEAHAPNPAPPEVRLEMAVLGAPLFAIAFFWFAWTSYPSISYWAPMMAGGLLGFSILWIFLALLNYIVDAYVFVAASALAASTVVRSIAGAAFPLFATQMYNALGPQWASSLLGFVALAMTPIPFVLIKFGPTLRRKSKYAPTAADAPKESDSSQA